MVVLLECLLLWSGGCSGLVVVPIGSCWCVVLLMRDFCTSSFVVMMLFLLHVWVTNVVALLCFELLSGAWNCAMIVAGRYGMQDNCMFQTFRGLGLIFACLLWVIRTPSHLTLA